MLKLDFEEVAQKEYWHFWPLMLDATSENTLGIEENKKQQHVTVLYLDLLKSMRLKLIMILEIKAQNMKVSFTEKNIFWKLEDALQNSLVF